MKLYINITQLSKFETLYRREEMLQRKVDRDTGIRRWTVENSDDIGEVEQILVRNNIKHQWDGK